MLIIWNKKRNKPQEQEQRPDLKMELGTGPGPGRQHVNVFKIKAKTAELSMPQCQYNNPPSVVFIKLNYINVRTAGGDE